MAAGDAIVGHVVTFGRVLREAGLEIGPGRLTDALRALDAWHHVLRVELDRGADLVHGSAVPERHVDDTRFAGVDACVAVGRLVERDFVRGESIEGQ